MTAPCVSAVDDAGLPWRTPALVARDERLFPVMVADLADPAGKGEPEVPAELTADALHEAFATHDSYVVTSAAFLAGRCRCDDRAAAARLAEELRGVVASVDVDRIGGWAPAYIEAAMSLGLRGEVAPARALLAPLVADRGARSTWGFLAAAYLAQLGDPSGYPALLAQLHGPSPHDRVMAARHLLAFVAHDGADVDGATVDVRAELVARLDDPDTMVSSEIPGLLAEAGFAPP